MGETKIGLQSSSFQFRC